MPVLASSADRRSHKISAAAHGSPVLILIMMCGRGVVGNFKVEAPCEGTYLPRASFEGRYYQAECNRPRRDLPSDAVALQVASWWCLVLAQAAT